MAYGLHGGLAEALPSPGAASTAVRSSGSLVMDSRCLEILESPTSTWDASSGRGGASAPDLVSAASERFLLALLRLPLDGGR